MPSLRHVVPFTISSAEALAAFRTWARTQILFPRNIMAGDVHEVGQSVSSAIQIRPSLLPFFCFSATFEVLHRNRGEGREDNGSFSEPTGEWLNAGTKNFSPALPEMQVYVGTALQRSVAKEAVIIGEIFEKETRDSVQIDIGTTGSISIGNQTRVNSGKNIWDDVHENELKMAQRSPHQLYKFPDGMDKVWIECKELSTGIAWYLVQRAVEASESGKLSGKIMPQHVGRSREGKKQSYEVRLKPLQKKCHRMYFPAYILDYSFGTTERNGKWVTQHHTALVSGVTGDLYAQSHLCPKQAAATTFLMSSAVMGSLSILPYWHFALPWIDSISLSQGAFFTAAASCMAYAGAWHQNFQTNQKSDHAAAMREAADAYPPKVKDQSFDSFSGEGSFSEKDEEKLREIESWEWNRLLAIEQRDKVASPQARKKWFESLWLTQKKRRRDIREKRMEIERQAISHAAKQMRQQRMNQGSHHSRFEGHSSFSQDGSARMAIFDSKGYYKALDLAPSATQTEVRQAFLKFARKCHPDLFSFDKKLQNQAESRFKVIQNAYKILNNSKLRDRYDRGLKID